MTRAEQRYAPRPATWLRKMTTGVCLAASVAPFLGTGAARGEPVAEAGVLIADGKARGVIYLAPEATPTARYAAAELRDHVKLATGAELPITNALPEEPATAVILVGPSAAAEARGVSAAGLGLEEHRLVSGENWLVLLGDDVANGQGQPFVSLTGWPGTTARNGTLLAVGPYYPFGTIFGRRAVKAPNRNYLVFGVHGGYYQRGSNAPIIWRSTDQGRSWGQGMRPWTQDAGEHCLVPLVDPSQPGRIYVFGNASRGNTHATGMVFRHSNNNGHTWSAPTTIVPGNDPTFPGAPIHMRGAVMPDGAWLWGAYYRDNGNNDTQYVLRSVDRGQNWAIAPHPHPQGWTHPKWSKFMEGIVVPISGAEAVLYLRAPGGRMYEKRTTDSGLTWGETQETPGLVHPDAPPMVFPFAGGKRLIAFIHNRYTAEHPHHYHPDRNALWFAVSDDAGRSWSEPRFLIAQAKHTDKPTSCDPDVSYVDLLVDGTVLPLFVGDGQRRALHLAFSEHDLAAFPDAARFAGDSQPNHC